ncbi:MAG: LysE family translocator [Ardenticatenaceae bacterium]|nr:LysE family translocator [Ardenticatenaceae bacterium]HBY96911.1 chemotaxis protein [Chloroflexota bacterium]
MKLIGMGFVMGIAFAAPPGALTVEAIRRGLAGSGFRPALIVGLGSLIGDGLYALLALAGLAALVDRPLPRLAVGAAGTVVLLWLAWATLRQGRDGPPDLDRGAARGGSEFLSGMAISLTNPFALVFWVSLGGTVAAMVGPDATTDTLVLFFTSFLLGSLLWVFILAGLVHWGQRFLGHLLGRRLTFACGLALGAFGLSLGSQILREALRLWAGR